MDYEREGLAENRIPKEKVLQRFDGKVHRLKLTDRERALSRMIEYIDDYQFLSQKQLEYNY